jgi:cell division septum initiation protein DivIVA
MSDSNQGFQFDPTAYVNEIIAAVQRQRDTALNAVAQLEARVAILQTQVEASAKMSFGTPQVPTPTAPKSGKKD